jgi:CheY-like chemotaxis protein
VDVATDGTHAMERIRATPYDVVLTDVRMPGEMDGFGLLERVREEMPHLVDRIVFLTGNVMDDATMERLTSLGTRCVEKPFDIHHLARVVNEVASLPRPVPSPAPERT